MKAQRVLVRDAVVDDAREIARVRVETWRAAYAGLVPQEVLEGMDVGREAGRRTERWSADHDDPLRHELVAVVDGVVVGWAACGPAREPLDEVTGELFALYASRERWSSGVGRALLLEVEERLIADGHGRAFLWVLADNERAARFYESHGWVEDGGEKIDEGMRERRRVRTLGPRRALRRLVE